MHKLPLAKKKELHVKNSKFGLGWEPSEYTSIAGDKEEKEIFNFAYEAALDHTGGDGKYRELDSSAGESNIWPKEEDLPGFYIAVKEYYGAVSAEEDARRGTSRHAMKMLNEKRFLISLAIYSASLRSRLISPKTTSTP